MNSKDENGFIWKKTVEDETESESVIKKSNGVSGNIKRNKMKKDNINPFIHNFSLDTTYDYCKLALMSVFILPIRVLMIMVCLVVAYFFSTVGMLGLPKIEHRNTPMSGWRRKIRWCMGLCGRMMMRCYGFHWVKIKGKIASRSEAPILVVGPHSSFMDGIAVFWSNVPGLVNRIENLQLPFFGKFIDFTQPVYVWREDTNSRQNTISEIKKRATSKDDWPQIIIFPEGTCTNRSCLIKFKPGAFYPGVPIQPVVLRYPNKTDCFTWTWDGPGAFKILWTTLCQFQNYCELEYLPVYNPNPEEINDPHLYAKNVRQVMADALGVPVMDYSYDDCRIMHKAKLKNLPHEVGLIGFPKLRQEFGLNLKEVEGNLLNLYSRMAHTQGKISLDDLSNYLGISKGNLPLLELFNSFDLDEEGVIDFRNFLIGRNTLMKEVTSEVKLKEAFKIFDSEGKGEISEETFCQVLKSSLSIERERSSKLFKDIDYESQGFLSFESFQSYAKTNPEYIKIFLDQNDLDQTAHPNYDNKSENEVTQSLMSSLS